MMMLKRTVYLTILLSTQAIPSILAKCLFREPPDSVAPPQQTDAGFYLDISGNPQFYEPASLYTVSLRGDKTQFSQKQFVEFLLVVENTARRTNAKPGEVLSTPVGNAGVGISSVKRTGSFQLLGDVLTRFSDHCTNTVTQTSPVSKSEIQVLWTAPPAGSGCVTFRATVVENWESWSMDTGRLSLELCEAKIEEHSKPDEVTEPCCACEEAKYEVTFQGLWSQQTHPKDFPRSEWLLHFSDIIGASHSADYRVWEYGGFASNGLSQVAKWGSPRVLESELKAESGHIRTIIKARGLWYPNVNGKTFAVFRTDRKNHLVSLVSMLGPSPDWIVGVSGLELCQKNCTWLEKKELFLYPWDAGVDNGISYESPDEATDPKQPITRITSRHPDDPRQPFWNDTSAPMKPLAKLSLNRQRLYKKSCASTSGIFAQAHTMEQAIFEDHNVVGCDASEWSAWSSCSVTCGKGISMRTRSFLQPEKAQMLGCDRQMVQKEMCSAPVPMCNGSMFYSTAPDNFLPDDMCSTSEWSAWSPCSATCGNGFESRTRRFFNRMGRKKCPHVETMEKTMCSAAAAVCPENEHVDPVCAVTSWSEWSPCSVSCGRGLKVRTRLYMVSPQHQTNVECKVQLMEKSPCEGARSECEFDKNDARTICKLARDMGPCRANYERWYFDPDRADCFRFVYGGCRGNANNFDRFDDCKKLCDFDDVDLSRYQVGSAAYHALTKAYREEPIMQKVTANMSTRKEEHYSQFSHLISPVRPMESLESKRRRMMDEERARQITEMTMMSKKTDHTSATKLAIPPVDCVVTAWSPWSDCNATCGKGFRRKFRMIKRHHAGDGLKCPKKLERRQKCRLPVCQQDCVIGEWGEWQACSQSCGSDGVQDRRRTVEKKIAGQTCAPSIERRICLLEPCPA